MGKVLVIGSREIEFSEEIQETIYFDNVVAVLYRKDKEIPNNVIFFNFKGNQLYTINDIVKAKVQRGYDHIEKKNGSILIAECEIGIIYEIDVEKKEVLNKTFVR